MKQGALRALGVALLLALLTGPAVLPGTFLSRRDAFRLHLPLLEFKQQELRAGRVPTRNHLDGLGASLEGTAAAAPLHPMSALLFFFPADVALNPRRSSRASSDRPCSRSSARRSPPGCGPALRRSWSASCSRSLRGRRRSNSGR